MTFQATVKDVGDATHDGTLVTFTPLAKWTYPRNNVPVQVRVVNPGDVLTIQVLPHLQPSWWVSDHIAHCKICAAIVHEHGANALPMPKPIDPTHLDPHGAPVKASLAGETGARSWWHRFVAGGGLAGVLIRWATRMARR